MSVLPHGARSTPRSRSILSSRSTPCSRSRSTLRAAATPLTRVPTSRSATTTVAAMLTFALGRGLEYYDKCAVDDLVRALEYNDYRFSSLVTAIAQSDPFTKRRGKRADEP